MARTRRARIRLGPELRDELQLFQDRFDQVVHTRDVAVLAGACPGEHGR
ncbi:hypothetical protein [Streptomyces nitrosporeus]